MAPLSTLLLLVLVLLCPARADELRTHDGRIFEGQVVSRDGERIHFRTPAKRLIFNVKDVASLRECPSVFDRYAERLIRRPTSPETSFEIGMAQWCEVHGMQEEQRIHARNAITLSPDHPEARRLAGEVRHGQAWISREEALRLQGYQKRGDQWISPAEVAAIEKKKAEARRLRALEARINRLLQELYDDRVATAERARRELLAISKEEGLTGLPSLVASVARDADQSRNAIVEVRAQHSELLGRRQRSLSLGSGTPVTIELPETRLTSIRTTVVAPAR